MRMSSTALALKNNAEGDHKEDEAINFLPTNDLMDSSLNQIRVFKLWVCPHQEILCRDGHQPLGDN